ncbi:serine protease [Streptosporangium sp. NPDC020145]|uniref:S1 family peptidase n=1 Tax=unclassified Streptosporangium TaxID=2632669 RepID=UPI00343AD199
MRVEPGEETWWVRIRQAGGEVLGAGVLLDQKTVLTCAHVIPDRAEEVVAEFVGQPGARPGTAKVVSWVPADDDQRGDLALLDLASPAPLERRPVLRRPGLWGREVYTRGFPSLLDDGLWVRARLGGRAGPGGEWIQMDAEPYREIRRGFSGAPVVDGRTGDVLGVVVSEFPGLAGLAWMIPVETIVHHLPALAGMVADSPSFTDQIREFFGPGRSGGAMVVVTGDAPVSTSLAEPAQHEEDVSGMTVAEVSRQVHRALERHSERQMFVFDAVDAADDPETLAQEVIRPLTEAGHQVITGLRQESARLRRILDQPSVARRLEVLDVRVTEARAAARATRARHRGVARLVTPVPDWPDDGPALQLRVRSLRRNPTLPDLEECESETRELLRKSTETHRELDRINDEYKSLKSLLRAYHLGSGVERSERDRILAERYTRAHHLLFTLPCDLAAASEAVDHYIRALKENR